MLEKRVDEAKEKWVKWEKGCDNSNYIFIVNWIVHITNDDGGHGGSGGNTWGGELVTRVEGVRRTNVFSVFKDYIGKETHRWRVYTVFQGKEGYALMLTCECVNGVMDDFSIDPLSEITQTDERLLVSRSWNSFNSLARHCFSVWPVIVFVALRDKLYRRRAQTKTLLGIYSIV